MTRKKNSLKKRKRMTEGISSVIDGRMLYTIAFMLFITQTFMERLMVDDIFGYEVSVVRRSIRYVVLVVLLLKVILYQRASAWQNILGLAMVILGYLVYQHSGANVFFWMMIFIACGKEIGLKDLAKTAFCVYLPGTVIVSALALSGVITNSTLTRTNGTLRYAMGFKHPNTFGLMLFMICISYCTMRFGKKPRSEFVLIAAGALLSQKVANSRTFTILLILLAFLLFVVHYARAAWFRTWMRILMAAGGGMVIAASLYFMFAYSDSNALVAKVNAVLSNRLSLGNLYYTTCGLALFGQKTAGAITFANGIRTVYFMVDNAYCHLIIRYGIAAMVVFAGLIAWFYADQIRHRRWGIYLIGITLFLILGFSENMTIKFEYNYFLIAVSHLLYRVPEETAVRRKQVRKRGKR